jgi:1-deoxy-D-xylulose-5-phosphate synthase
VAIQSLPVIFCMDRAGMVGDDGQTHMGLYDIPYMLSVPNMTVTAPRDGAELIGLLRCALRHEQGPFSLRYPRDKVPAEPPRAADVAAVPYGTWEVLRRGRHCAILAVGVMCAQAMAAAAALAADGVEATVVNCRFLKPIDRATLDALAREHRLFVTVEDGVVTNGFGAYLAGIAESAFPDVRVVPIGAPDRTWEHAPRPFQLAEAGLTADAIAGRVRALLAGKAPAAP